MIAKDQPTILDEALIQARVSSKKDGSTKNYSADDLQEVSQHIKDFSEQAGFDYDQVVSIDVGAHQNAWDEIVEVSTAPSHALIKIEDRVIADALVTVRNDVVLVLPVADCNAVVIHDPVRGVLAIVHLGWQSTAAELATKIVTYLVREHRSSPSDLRIYVSPSIRAESYVFDKVSQEGDPAWQSFLHTTEKGIGIDLPGYNRQRFIEAGVPESSIEICPVNTATSDDYFSHYRAVRSGEPDGRFALFASLQ